MERVTKAGHSVEILKEGAANEELGYVGLINGATVCVWGKTGDCLSISTVPNPTGAMLEEFRLETTHTGYVNLYMNVRSALNANYGACDAAFHQTSRGADAGRGDIACVTVEIRYKDTGEIVSAEIENLQNAGGDDE